MSVNVSYRQATVADCELLAHVRVEEFIEPKDMAEELKAKLYTRNKIYFKEALGDGTFAAFLAFDGDRLAGTSGVIFYRIPPHFGNHTGKKALIENMYTRPEYRCRGIATKLLSLCMEEARRRGCGQAELWAADMARPIYEKYGFVEIKSEMEYGFKENNR